MKSRNLYVQCTILICVTTVQQTKLKSIHVFWCSHHFDMDTTVFDDHLIIHILNDLEFVVDVVRSAMVCKKWNHLSKSVNRTSLTFQLPETWGGHGENVRGLSGWARRQTSSGTLRDLQNVKIIRDHNEGANMHWSALMMCLSMVNIDTLFIDSISFHQWREYCPTSVTSLTLFEPKCTCGFGDTLNFSTLHKSFPKLTSLSIETDNIYIDSRMPGLTSLKLNHKIGPRIEFTDKMNTSRMFSALTNLHVTGFNDINGNRVIQKLVSIDSIKTGTIKLKLADDDEFMLDEMIVYIPRLASWVISNKCGDRTRFGLYIEKPKIEWCNQ